MKKTLQILTIFTLSLNAYAQVPNYVPSNGLVGWWPFNGNANDESGNGNNGTVNGATLTSDRFGNANKAYSFDGVNDYVSTYRSGYTSFSISLWYKLPLSNATVYPLVDGFDSYYDIYFTQGTLYYATFTGINYANIDCNVTPSIGQWRHLVIVYSGNNVSIYSNSSLVGTHNVQPLSGTTGDHNFGASLTGTDQYLNGILDDIGIWDRALTACEIQNLYTSTNPTNTTTVSACNNYTWNGQSYSQSGIYIGTTVNCVTESLDLTINQNASSTITQTALDSYTLNGQTYTQSGTYTQVVPAANGCDSTITLNLTLNFTGIHELVNSKKILVKITDLNGKIIQRRKNTVMLFIYEDGTVERVVEME